MAAVAFTSFAVKSLPTSRPAGVSSFLPPPVAANHIVSLRSGGVVFRRLKAVRAVLDDDEWGREPEPAAGAATAEPTAGEEGDTVAELKTRLKEALYGTDRGIRASSETRGEVVEIITQLEARNPTPAPTEALQLLNGKWILAYTSFSQLLPLLKLNSLLVRVDEISQTIDAQAFTVQNSIKFVGPLTTTSLSTNAKFEVRSPKRVQIKFVQGVIGTPQLTDSIEIPENIEFLGQKIDLTPFRRLFAPLQNAASSISKTISNRPLKIPLSSRLTQSWLLTTYLDDDLRISRGDGTSVFVLVKEGSSLSD